MKNNFLKKKELIAIPPTAKPVGFLAIIIMKITETKLRNIIQECVKNILLEVDLSQDGNISTYRQSITAWKMIYTAMEEIKRVMDETTKNKGGVHNIGTDDVQMILDHIDNTIDNCLSSTLPQLRKNV